MRLPGDAWHRPYPRVHKFGNAVLVVLVLCCTQCPQALAQPLDKINKNDKADKGDQTGKNTPASIDLGSQVDPAKKAAIKELLSLTRMTDNYSTMKDVMLGQVRRMINVVLQKSITDDPHYGDSQKKQMLDTLSDSSDRIINRYRELSGQRINMAAVMEQVAYKVYDESFTTSELQDLITFYRTATGQKALKKMPEIMKRSMTLSSQLIQSKIMDLTKELIGEEFARLKLDAHSPSYAAASTSSSSSSSTGATTTSTAASPANHASTAAATPASTAATTPASTASTTAAATTNTTATNRALPASSGQLKVSPSK